MGQTEIYCDQFRHRTKIEDQKMSAKFNYNSFINSGPPTYPAEPDVTFPSL